MADGARAGFSLNLDDVMEFPKGGIFSRVLVKSAYHNYTLMCLSAGTEIDTHTSTKNGCVVVLKGTGIFRLYEKDIALMKGVFVHMPKDAPHSISASEDLAVLLCLSD